MSAFERDSVKKHVVSGPRERPMYSTELHLWRIPLAIHRRVVHMDSAGPLVVAVTLCLLCEEVH